MTDAARQAECECCGRHGERSRVRGQWVCSVCRRAWLAGYEAALWDAYQGKLEDFDGGMCAADIAEEMADG